MTARWPGWEGLNQLTTRSRPDNPTIQLTPSSPARDSESTNESINRGNSGNLVGQERTNELSFEL